MNNKPESITIIGTLAILLGIWFIFFDVIKEFYPLITSFNLKPVVDATDYRNAIKVIFTVLFVNSIKNILLIIGGVGLLKLRKWSLFLLAVVSIYYLFFSFILPLIKYIISNGDGILVLPPTPLFFVLFIWPIFSREVRNYLK